MKYIERLNRKSYYVTSIDSCKCLTVKELFQQLKEAFDFPEYSGNKFNEVINDYITDLSWIKEKNFKLLVYNISKFNKQDSKRKNLLLDKLDYIKRHWDQNKNEYENNFIIEFVSQLSEEF